METNQNTNDSQLQDQETIVDPAGDAGLQCVCTITNYLSLGLTLSSAPKPNDGSYTYGPVSSIAPNSSAGVHAFTTIGQKAAATGPSGTVSYSFEGIYGQVTCLITYNVPYTRQKPNTFTAVLQGNVGGASGTYACNYGGGDGIQKVVQGQVGLWFTAANEAEAKA